MQPTTSHLGIQRAFSGILAALLAAALFSCARKDEEQRPASYDGPQIVVEEKDFDFGECFLGFKKTHVFTIKNTGTRELRITDIKRECGCLIPEFQSKVIPPGGQVPMKVVFEPPVMGAIKKRIRVYSNDEYAQETIINITAFSLGPAHLQPIVMTLDADVPPGGLHRTLRLRVDENETILAVRFLSDCPWLKFETPAETGGSEVSIQLQILPPPGPGSIYEKVVVDISTRNKKGETRRFALPLPFQLRGELRPVLFAVPDVLHLGVRPVAKAYTVDFVVKGATSHSEKPTIVTDDMAGLSVRRADTDAGRFVVQVPPGPAGRFAGSIRLVWESGAALRIPVLGVRR